MSFLKWCNLVRASTNCRRLSTCTKSSSPVLFENLSSSRSLIRVSGNEVAAFLQGLITNDINHITAESPNISMFTMFLNKQGRVLYDAIIYRCKKADNTFFIECDQSIDEQLQRHLQTFRVRKKISIDNVNNELNVWQCFQQNIITDDNTKETAQLTKKEPLIKSEHFISCIDARLYLLGTRLIAPIEQKIDEFQKLCGNNKCTQSTDQYNYIQHRYVCGVSEGTIEIASGKSFPFEANCDFLHGISFHKGCYLGQEFTARTYHTGVIRKRIMPLLIQNDTSNEKKFDYDTPILNEKDQTIGKLKGYRNKNAIGALNVDAALKSTSLKINDLVATTYRPSWWPQQKSSN